MGGILATPMYLLWDYIQWSSSGIDSGPPAVTYSQWIASHWFTVEPLVVISLGAVTAAAYHFLARSTPRIVGESIVTAR